MRSTLLALFATGTLLAVPAFAGPPDTARIGASAEWAVHLDVEALTNSALATGMVGLMTGEDSPLPADRTAKALAAWEKLHQVRSVTVFGPSASRSDAVAVVDLDYDKAAVMRMLRIAADATGEAHGDHVVHVATVKCPRKAKTIQRRVCFYNETTIVAGARLAAVQTALDVLDGKSAGLADTGALAGMLAPTPGSVLLAAAPDLSGLADRARTTLLRNAQSVRFECGESDEDAFMTFEAVLNAEDDAKVVQEAARGFVAMAKMLCKNRPEIASLLDSVVIARDGAALSVSAQHSVASLIDLASNFLASSGAAE